MPDTAIREVMEECGLKHQPEITGELEHTYHTYLLKNERILKHVVWYRMICRENDSLHPQLSEDITEAVWIPENQLDMVLQNTYPSIKQVLDKWKPEQDNLS